MSQDFSDLGIDIDDFLADLIKIRQEEEKSFEIYNNCIKMKSAIPSMTNSNKPIQNCQSTLIHLTPLVNLPLPTQRHHLVIILLQVLKNLLIFHHQKIS
jgi:hypothetical protein